jgi:hypothetical protein
MVEIPPARIKGNSRPWMLNPFHEASQGWMLARRELVSSEEARLGAASTMAWLYKARLMATHDFPNEICSRVSIDNSRSDPFPLEIDAFHLFLFKEGLHICHDIAMFPYFKDYPILQEHRTPVDDLFAVLSAGP